VSRADTREDDQLTHRNEGAPKPHGFEHLAIEGSLNFHDSRTSERRTARLSRCNTHIQRVCPQGTIAARRRSWRHLILLHSQHIQDAHAVVGDEANDSLCTFDPCGDGQNVDALLGDRPRDVVEGAR
jgi:hypothetical protein